MRTWNKFSGWSLALGIALAGAMVFSTNHAQAAAYTAVAQYSVSVTVDNSFDLANTTPISFGSIAAVNSTTAADVATLSMNGQTGVGTVTNGTVARIIVITAGTPGTVSVTGAPPSTAMSVIQPGPSSGTAGAVTLTNPADANAATFSATLTATGQGFSLTTSAAGALTIKIGGALKTVVSANSYSDGTYTGTYYLSVYY